MGPEHRHAVLDPAGAVGDAAEVVAAHGLLIGAEAAVVGRRGLQMTGLEGAPQHLLVFLRPEGRAHHIGGRRRPVGMAIDGIVDQQMARQHLAIDPLALEPGAGDGLDRLLAGIMDDIERGVDHLGQADHPVGGLALDLGRAGEGMALGAGDALLQDLLLQEIDEIAVLGMDGGERPQLLAAPEALQHLLVGDHDGPLVGHEMLEAVDPMAGGQHPHLLPHLVRPPGDGDMEGIIGRRFLGPAHPLVIGLEQGDIGGGDDEIDDHGGAAGERGGGAAEEILARHRAHEGQLHMGMGIDAAGHHILARRRRRSWRPPAHPASRRWP